MDAVIRRPRPCSGGGVGCRRRESAHGGHRGASRRRGTSCGCSGRHQNSRTILLHATRELVELAAHRHPAPGLIYHDRFDSRICSEPRGLAAGYRWLQYSIHRDELQMMSLHAGLSSL
ncbi:MAG: hypothetical protein M3460_26760 [Actinomycetota bacterium]|nr:hypothetical protein [Actinomycetota bacterium]